MAIVITMAFCAGASAATVPTIKVGQAGGSLGKLAIASEEVPLQESGGGFVVLDFHAGKKPLLRQGVVEIARDGSHAYHAEGEKLTLDARFTPQADGTVRVRGRLTNATGEDRPVILRYVLPLRAPGARVEHELSDSTTVDRDTQTLGTVFPLVAMASGKSCGVLAIPPTFPCCFGMTGSAEGLGVEFYLGLTPATKHFPNQAGFEFLIYTADAAAPFRSALSRYYAFFPEYYKLRFQGGGFWNRQEQGDINEALHLYRYEDLSTKKRTFPDNVARNRSQGVLSFGYLLVGQREVKPLPDLPKDYDGTMRVYQEFARHLRETPGTSPGTLATPLLPDLIDRCTCTEANGRYVVQPRLIGGQKAVTFTMNPNPELFADKGLPTVGGIAIDGCTETLGTEPLDGFDLDSVGSHWPATLNFRRDHVPYARYPLTFDEQGRVALHNWISHYEFMEKLRELVHSRGKLFFANGIDTYQRKSAAEPSEHINARDAERFGGIDTYQRKGLYTEHYNSHDNGRFFLAALLDTAGRENTTLLERHRLERYRAQMGPKLFTMLLYKWEDPEVVRVQMNRALAYAIFACPNDLQNVGYVNAPNGYRRDKPLLEWFIKNARLLQDAGWEPVTHATVSSADVSCERYGNGNAIYFALLNFAEQPRPCEMVLDLQALGMSSEGSSAIEVHEIAQNAKIDHRIQGNTCRVRVQLDPNRTQILQFQGGSKP